MLQQFYKSAITIQEFASFLRQFHMRPMPEVLLPPVDTFTKIFEADDGREHTAMKAESAGFLQVHYSQSASCYHLGFTTVGLPPTRRVFVDRVIYGSWAYHEKILPGMEILKVDKKDVYNMSLTQYVNALKHASEEGLVDDHSAMAVSRCLSTMVKLISMLTCVLGL